MRKGGRSGAGQDENISEQAGVAAGGNPAGLTVSPADLFLGEPSSARFTRMFRSRLRAWYRAHARDLPWRGIHDPYATWLSEIMLQQTRVATVIDRYAEFLRRFPTIEALAAAAEDDVLALWSGLGYYRRARMLHRGAQFVVRERDGSLPGTSAELRTLPGVGEYTAAAIASIAFGESIAVVDGNVERVLLRVLGLSESRAAARRAEIHAAARKLVPSAVRSARKRAAPERANPPGDHNQAMMELGATICLPREPLCLECPVFPLCRTRGEHPTLPRGEPQSRVAAHLLVTRKRGTATEVLLLRRPDDASLMPRMLELPPLPVEAVEGREPVLRLRHSITNTNYLVRIYAEGAQASAAEAAQAGEAIEEEQAAAYGGLLSPFNEEAVFAAPGRARTQSASTPQLRAAVESSSAVGASVHGQQAARRPDGDPEPPLRRLLSEVPASAADLHWTALGRLGSVPLTGLTRKCLQRLQMMDAAVPPPRS